MPKKKKDLTSWIEAGKQNLATWKRENPAGGNLKHGIYSKTIQKRYSDKTTPEGRALEAILDAIREDIGPELDAQQNLLMSLIRAKLIIVLQIGGYIESVAGMIDFHEGKAPHVVARTFPAYSKGLTQLLNRLYGANGGKGSGQGAELPDPVEEGGGSNLIKRKGGVGASIRSESRPSSLT